MKKFLLLFLGVIIVWGAVSSGSYLIDKWRFKKDLRAAESGDLAAQHRVGRAYSAGKLVTQNDALAVKWWKKAGSKGYPNSLHNLAIRYEEGRGVDQDYKEAFLLYEKASNLNFAASMVNLGHCYERGEGVKNDREKARYWFQKSAELNNKIGQYRLAKWYEQYANKHYGYEGADGEEQMRYWYAKSAELGYAQSQFELAKLYMAENGKFGHDAKAVELLKKAGKNGIGEAYYMAGLMYFLGKGVAVNKFHAARYFLLSMKQGHIEAGKGLMACVFSVWIK